MSFRAWMIPAATRHNDHRTGYIVRAEACLVAALLLAVALVRLWPIRDAAESKRPDFRSVGQETIEIEQIQQTRQRAQKPPPPPPTLQVVVSEEEILDDLELDLPDDFLAFSEEDGEAPEVPVGAQTSGPPDLVEPRPVRIVEPEYTREARRRKIRAEVVVEVLVDERGTVRDARILERFLLDKDRKREPVAALGYGLEESALAAARRCLFRPARFGGKTVRGYKTLRFSFGV